MPCPVRNGTPARPRRRAKASGVREEGVANANNNQAKLCWGNDMKQRSGCSVFEWATGIGLAIIVAGLQSGCSSFGRTEPPSAVQSETEGAVTEGRLPFSPPLPTLDENATREDYVSYALLNNAGLRAGYSRWMAALQKVPQVKSLPNPTVGYSYFIESIETRVGPQRHRFELMQMIPFPGKLGLRGEAAFAAAKAEGARFEQEKRNVLFRVKDAYYEYYYLAQAIRVTEENVGLLTRLEEVASQQVRAGASQQDMLRAQVELGKLQDRLASLRDMRGVIEARLNAELNRPITTPIPWVRQISGHTPVLTQDELFAFTRDGNWELRSLDFDIEKSRKAVALARKEFYPDIGVGVGYVATGEAQAGAMNPDDNGKDAVAVMVSVSLPVWRGRLKGGLEEARAALAAATEARQHRENMLLSQVRIALYRYNDAVRQVRLYGETLIPKGEQALSSAEAGYRAGKVDFVNIIDSERQLLAFHLAYERALADQQQRLAELEMLAGRPLATGLSAENKASAAP